MAGSRNRRGQGRSTRTARSRGEEVSANSTPSVQDHTPSEERGNGEVPPPPPPPDFMQAFLAGIAQFAAQAANGGGNPNAAPADPFTGALREFERHRTPHFDGSGGYAAAEDWLGAVEQSFRLSRTPEAYKAEALECWLYELSFFLSSSEGLVLSSAGRRSSGYSLGSLRGSLPR